MYMPFFTHSKSQGEALEGCLIRVTNSRVLSDAVCGCGSESLHWARSGDLTFSKSNICLARMFLHVGKYLSTEFYQRLTNCRLFVLGYQ